MPFIMNNKMETVETFKTVEGNTSPPPNKRLVPSKYWCITEWEVDLETWKSILEVGDHGIKFACGGAEICPETKKHHIHLYLEFDRKVRGNEALRNIIPKSAHWEKRKGTRSQAIEYAIKDGDYFINGNYVPKMDYLITKKDLRQNQVEIIKLFEKSEHPKFGRKIYWFWERKGGWGKSVLCKYMVDQMRF